MILTLCCHRGWYNRKPPACEQGPVVLDTGPLPRFIYTEVVAGLSILLALLWLLPFSGSLIHWPVDLVISFCWFAAFGLLVDWLGGRCGDTFDWSGLGFRGNNCGSWKAGEAFAFLSAVCWLVSALLGIYWTRRHIASGTEPTRRRRWYRSRV
ncbi:integral membrane protein [Diaporthe helianthi]|uniref:Integral membrane protein n=1 Tax=Diaporthe helianthi TaxID=158607 RepID=A0A2P5HJ36_DIAHE|nr:integral membrane protein [Diaporthe helianthi]